MSNSSDVTRRTAIRVALATATVVATGAVRTPSHNADDMERVEGIGGFFFRAKDPKSLGEWYEANLGISTVPRTAGAKPWQTSAGATAFQPFKEDTTYFGDARFHWMINFRVRNLDKMVAQLRDRGISVDVDAHVYPNGRFARLNDPEGNPIQLWQPQSGDVR